MCLPTLVFTSHLSRAWAYKTWWACSHLSINFPLTRSLFLASLAMIFAVLLIVVCSPLLAHATNSSPEPCHAGHCSWDHADNHGYGRFNLAGLPLPPVVEHVSDHSLCRMPPDRSCFEYFRPHSFGRLDHTRLQLLSHGARYSTGVSRPKQGM